MATTVETGRAAVDVRALVKKYPKGPKNAVDELSFTVSEGEVFGLLGPNGAGKTTTVGILTTRIRPTGGSAAIRGIDVMKEPVRARRHLAVVPQRTNMDRSLSVRQNLVFHAAYHGIAKDVRNRRADQLLAEFGLEDRANDRLDRFSGGQERRVLIARAMMHNPHVLFLDEPTTGLDPAARLFVWQRLAEMKERGLTIVLTTHDMEEAATLSDRVGIMDQGKLLALDTTDRLTESVAGKATLEIIADVAPPLRPGIVSWLKELDEVVTVEPYRTPAARGGLSLRLYVTTDPASLVPVVTGKLAEQGGKLTQVKFGMPSLEDVYIKLTGRALR
jgi:ABC-2 type transport system ATP-binding protein